MALPVVPLATNKVDIGNDTVEFRSLSRSEALSLTHYKGQEDEAEIRILMWGTGCSEDEAKAFRDGTDTNRRDSCSVRSNR
jgi:hypothetical protein